MVKPFTQSTAGGSGFLIANKNLRDDPAFQAVIKKTGYEDRAFDTVTADGHIYKYNIWYHCSTDPSMRAVLLLQMIDDTHLKIEKRNVDIEPPWTFTENAVVFER